MENGDTQATKRDIEQLRLGTKQDIEQLRLSTKQDFQQFRSDTKQDIQQLRSETKQDVEQLRSEMNHGYRDLVERITDSETKLLKAFYSFTESNQKRFTQVEGNEAALRSRVASIETRLLEVEKRLNMPPSA